MKKNNFKTELDKMTPSELGDTYGKLFQGQLIFFHKLFTNPKALLIILVVLAGIFGIAALFGQLLSNL